ncbi:YfkD family protein [Virgibacillus flavescens]|uniref:YfkD family protein n=1 Tax=Virgibacillus flavescens TaxID=1611422 RepID=UPI003D34DF33
MNRKPIMKAVIPTIISLLLIFPTTIYGKEKMSADKDFAVPNHVLTISKENTYSNSSEDQEIVEPSKATKELIEKLDISVDNPDLIKMLNESSVKPTPFSIGYRGMIYLGRWAINYKSTDTTVNWEYQKVNTNEINNVGGTVPQKMHYVQKEQRKITGALVNKIASPDDVKKMILVDAIKETNLPLSYETVIGIDTEKENEYTIPVNKFGRLTSYVPAVIDKGQVTFGDVYIQLKGSKKAIQIKNVTKQGIGAWIPIQDHLGFSFTIQ